MAGTEVVDDNDPWDSGEPGRPAEHAKWVDAEKAAAADESLGLQLISLRLHRDLLRQLKTIAEYRGVGYQPMIRDVLSRWAGREIVTMVEEMRAQEAIETKKVTG